MNDQKTDDLFPAVLRQPASLWWVAVFPSLVLTLVNAFCFWLIWGEMKGGFHQAYAGTLIALSALPALEGALAVWLGRRRPEGVPTWAHLLIAVLCLVHLVAFCCLIGHALPRQTPDWVIGPSFCFAQFACMMPGLFVGLWRIAGVRLGLAPLADFGASLLMTFLPPAVLYFGVAVFSRLFSWHRAESLLGIFLTSLLIVGPVILFLGLLRCLMIIRRFFVQQGGKNRVFGVGYIGCVALVLPLAGLLLNRKIPFPADFQNPWSYVLTALNAAALMVPPTGRAWLDAAVRALRRVLFPFACYFFVVFLPFLPFSIVAILAMGTGFLVLAPTLLFMLQGQILKRDLEEESARVGRRVAWLRTAFCLLVLPGVFFARTEFDRWTLLRTLEFRQAKDSAADSELSVSPAHVKRVLLNVRRFKDGAEMPYLTNWYNWRVFDNLLLQDTKLEELWRLIVGGQPPARGKEDLFRNEFASLFGGKTRTPGARLGRAAQRVPQTASLAEVQSSFATTNGETETRVRLKVVSPDVSGQTEYVAKLSVPPGVWVSGFRLKIGGAWSEGRVIERKAAEWVYRQIRDASRRDPAILRYEDDGSLSLRVFPVTPSEPREVEIAFLSPEGLADAVAVGERRVALGNGALKPLCAWANGVFACNAAWQPPEEARVAPEAVGHLVLDCSAGAAWTDSALSDALRRAEAAAGAPLQDVLLANYERRVASASVQSIRAKLLPSRGALDAATVLRYLAETSGARSFADAGSHAVQRPRIVFAGPSARGALDAVTPSEWGQIREAWPLLTDVLVLDERGAVTPFVVPGAPDSADDVVALRAGAETHPCIGRSAACLIFPSAGDGQGLELLTLRPGLARAAPVPGLLVVSAESRWAQGAAAWRLQRSWDRLPVPARNAVRREALAASRASGVLTPGGSYIVVENSMQWKMLEVKQWQTLAGNAALDLVESPAPGWLPVLIACVLSAWIFARIRRRKRT